MSLCYGPCVPMCVHTCSHLYINPAHSLCIRCVYHACFTATFLLFLAFLTVSSVCMSYFSNVFVFLFFDTISCVMSYKIFIYVHLPAVATNGKKKSCSWNETNRKNYIERVEKFPYLARC